MNTEPCRLGREEHDGYRYCHEHGGFANAYGNRPGACDRRPCIRQRRRSERRPDGSGAEYFDCGTFYNWKATAPDEERALMLALAADHERECEECCP